ncbi:Bromodomain-containing protein [Neurospora tetraspora]|uniref:Bromodomain-containing protein n=1 Tax=Neurospora tetraspora TaxID=94610 RepID=A0AAE0JNY5_9PEZI|nr:Bromodomain-containing protein [Neurospora tetraspora]
MDNKRKASISNGANIQDGDDRAAKRTKKEPGPYTDYDLNIEETHESTTAYGLHFLEMIRRTKDKSGRTVANCFEDLIPREGNEDYYRRIKLPISLKTIERKLHNQDFANMSELEGYFKRMVMNAKEYYNKGSDIFEDAERVRKALSNYMTKTNPAYKRETGYSCTAAPIPGEEDDDESKNASQNGTKKNSSNGSTNGSVKSVRKRESPSVQDTQGEDDVEGEDDDHDDDHDESGDEDNENPRRIVIKRRESGRPTARSTASPVPTSKPGRGGRKKADHEYENVPYKGLNFQQAQEKIVEELIRKPDGSDPYFLDFINLPPRSFKDYFAVITEPLSLKGLQKLVKGIYGRASPTGVSEFKSWAAFEEKASLLWNNAHYYNEEGSVIYDLATELKNCFEKELDQAKAFVQEPPQPPKIKLKVAPGSETPSVSGPKKITIHVGGSRGSAAASPAPPTGQSIDSNHSHGAVNGNRVVPSAVPAISQDKARSLSVSAAPSPAVTQAKLEGGVQQSPVPLPPRAGVNGAAVVPGTATPGLNSQQPGSAALQNGHVPIVAPPPPPPIWDKTYRAPGRGLADALIHSILIRTHPSIPLERRFRLEVPAHPKLAQQNLTVHLPTNHSRLQLIPRLSPILEQQQRQYRLFITINGSMVGRATPLPISDDPLPVNAIVFDLPLQPGTTVISVTMIAALPKGQKLPSGAECELERISINAFLPRV